MDPLASVSCFYRMVWTTSDSYFFFFSLFDFIPPITQHSPTKHVI